MSDQRRSRPRVLLSSVFGPFARDDEFGSRAINPLEPQTFVDWRHWE